MYVNDENLQRYLKNIGTFPLLRKEEEIELARKGDKDSLDKLVNSNLRFVVSLAKRYQNRGLSLLDLIEEGNLGIIKAAEKFDETRGYRFISYATWWIRQSIRKAIGDQPDPIRIPPVLKNTFNKITRYVNTFEVEQGYSPPDEILIKKFFPDSKKPKIQIRRYHEYKEKKVSLDCEGINLHESLPDTSINLQESFELNDSYRSLAQEVERTLNQRERRIITLYYGENSQTLESIGQEMKLSRERIRQIRNKALEKLRESKAAKELNYF